MTTNVVPVLDSYHRRTLQVSAWLAIVLGAICLIAPFYTGLAATMLLGGYFLVSGVLEGIVAFRAPSWMGVAGLLALAVVSVIAGLFILVHPLAGLVTLTLVCIASIFVAGIMKLYWSVRVQNGKAILALSGVLSILISVLLYANFPTSAAWVFGVLIGLNLIMEGALLLGFLSKEA